MIYFCIMKKSFKQNKKYTLRTTIFNHKHSSFTELDNLISFLKLFHNFGNDTAGKLSRCLVLGILISYFFFFFETRDF